MSITSVGIDLGKTTFHLVALDDHGKIVARARSERHLPFHARDRDFREIQPALLLSWFSGVSAVGTILRRDSTQPWLLQVGTPSFGSSHCVKTTQATRNAIPQTQFGTFTFSYLPTPSLRRKVIIGHQSVNPD